MPTSLIRLERLSEDNVEALAQKYRAGYGINPRVEAVARRIVEDVAKLGDKAIIEYTQKLDGVKLTVDELRVDIKEVQNAYSEVSEDQIASLKLAKRRIEQVEKMNRESVKETFISQEGVDIRYTLRPIGSVGCYAPGGRAWYPSSLLMAAIPARTAGVSRIVACTPPSKSKQINPLMLIASDLCGIREYYRVGGAQAIAALAYGTESIRPVQKIVGPGGSYVAAAKTVVSSRVAIDLPAGPSEILIIADESAKAEFIARDLISQAEHGEESICGLITLSEKLAENVVNTMRRILVQNRFLATPRSGVVDKDLKNKGFILNASNLNDAVAFINLFAPEHLEILTEKPMDIASKINSAGLMLLGGYTPVAASDYCIGVNHILPTAGFAQSYSGLSVLDFVRRVGVVECSRQGLQRISESIGILAEAEGLANHAWAVKERFKVG